MQEDSLGRLLRCRSLSSAPSGPWWRRLDSCASTPWPCPSKSFLAVSHMLPAHQSLVQQGGLVFMYSSLAGTAACTNVYDAIKAMCSCILFQILIWTCYQSFQKADFNFTSLYHGYGLSLHYRHMSQTCQAWFSSPLSDIKLCNSPPHIPWHHSCAACRAELTLERLWISSKVQILTGSSFSSRMCFVARVHVYSRTPFLASSSCWRSLIWFICAVNSLTWAVELCIFAYKNTSAELVK